MTGAGNHWKGTWTLKDYIIYLVASRQTESHEYKTMVKIYGKEKIDRIWEDHVEKQKPRTEAGLDWD
jgi:hypothetical protein